MDPRLCVLCRGRGWCGRVYCPVLAKASALASLLPKLSPESTDLEGFSPPTVFVGRVGYPRVLAGVGATPDLGKAVVGDSPEAWIGMRLEEVLAARLSIVFGRKRVSVLDTESRFVSKLQEVALSAKPLDLEIAFEKPPKPVVSLSAFEPPMGPRGVAKDVRVYGSSSSWRVVERVYSDGDLRAFDAIVELYRHGVPVSAIQRLLSVGALGRKGWRRLVPTRWAITAVDDAIGRWLASRVRSYPELGEAMAFVRKVEGNTFVAIFLPGKWSFEWLEAWFPGSTWNPAGREVVIEGDFEGFGGRKDYPSIGGCYFASRLAVLEYLDRVGRQATVVTLREIYPGFDIPIGVWFVRENVREMLRGKPIKLRGLEDLRELLDRFTKLGSSTWINASRILSRLARVKPLDRYLGSYTTGSHRHQGT